MAAYGARNFGVWIQLQLKPLDVECLIVNPAGIPKSQNDILQKIDPRDACNVGLRL